MIPVAGIVGLLNAGAELAGAVKKLLDKTPDTPDDDGPDFAAIATAVGDLVTHGAQLYEDTKDVLNATDEAAVKAALDRIQASNDALYQTTSSMLDEASRR